MSFFMSIFISIYIVTSFPLGVRDKGANGRFKSQIFNAQIIDKISTNYKKDLKFASAAIIIESLQLLYILCIYSSDASLSRSEMLIRASSSRLSYENLGNLRFSPK